MSETNTSGVVRGCVNLTAKAEEKWRETLSLYGEERPVAFPDTSFYLPVTYGILGIPVNTLGDIRDVFLKCRVSVLDEGTEALIAGEIIIALGYLESPLPETQQEDTWDVVSMAGAASDALLKKTGIGLIDGSIPGIAVVSGTAAEDEFTALTIMELRKRNIYIFTNSKDKGTRLPDIVSSCPDISAAVFAAGFVVRMALIFGRIQPGDYKEICSWVKNHLSAFSLLLGDVTSERYAVALGLINFGFPVITDTQISGFITAGSNTGDYIISNITHDCIVARAVEAARLKVAVNDVPIPVAFDAAFEGERVRDEEVFLECGNGSPMVEWVTSSSLDDIKDGIISVIGPGISDIRAGSRLPLAIVVNVAGRDMQQDYEPVIERQIHRLLNYAWGVMHTGQRDSARLRISMKAVEKGFTLSDIGTILHAGLHRDFSRIIDKLQVNLYTDEKTVREISVKAGQVYQIRDARTDRMTDESVDTFYSCTICQSLAPGHVCTISPERAGLCGSYNWIDCSFAYNINPFGPNQPVPKGSVIDPKMGQWEGINEFVRRASCGKTDHYNLYSIISDPVTTSICCECIAAVLPRCNGVMTVNREYNGDTPCGMRYDTLMWTIGDGQSTPGFMGHGKYNTVRRKFISGDGGLMRMVWMPVSLKKEIGERINTRGEEMGIPGFLSMIADETIGVTEEEILPFLKEKGHPALKMNSLLN